MPGLLLQLELCGTMVPVGDFLREPVLHRGFGLGDQCELRDSDVCEMFRHDVRHCMAVRLLRGGQEVAAALTNADGRSDGPLVAGDSLQAGLYRLEFEVGAYFRALGVALPQPAFLETVVIDFGVADAAGHYHVPLLVSPFAYSTYRGS